MIPAQTESSRRSPFGWLKKSLIGVLAAGAVYSLITFVFLRKDPFLGVPEVEWGLLAQAEADFVPEEIKKLVGPEIKLAGFVVPLSDNFKEIREFLLVPDPMSCIHVPPPPFNQMVLVKTAEPMNPQLAYGPVWVKGSLSLDLGRTEFGEVAYGLKASHVTLYDGNPWKK